MSLQWRLVAGLVYTQCAMVVFLLLPWIRPALWRSLFTSRLAHSLGHLITLAGGSAAVVLLILFTDAVRQVQEHAHITEDHAATAGGDALGHMKLFYAERNFYLSGFALLLFLVIRRLVILLSRAGDMERAAESAIKEADASKGYAAELLRVKTERDQYRRKAEMLQAEYIRLTERKQSAGGKKRN